MSGIETMNEMLAKDPGLQEKVNAEIRRLADSKEATEAKEAFAGAVRTVLGIRFTEEELDGIFAKCAELNPEELEQASGGGAVGAVAGAMVGSWAGGQVGGVFGPAGSCVGAAIGAVGGGIFGSWLEDNF